MNDKDSARRLPWLPCLSVFAIAFAVRLFFFLKIPRDHILPNTNWELDSIAMSLVESGRFADPYVIPTGPTAHLPPVPPLIVAGIYEVFGVTMLGGTVTWLYRIVLQSGIWALLPWIGQRTGLGWQAGLIGGVAAAFFPQWIGHGEPLAAVLLALLIVAVITRWDGMWPTDRPAGRPAFSAARSRAADRSGRRAASSLLLGAGFGFSFHVQPVFVLVFLGYLAFEVWRRSDRRRWAAVGVVLLGALLASLPWGVRNARAFDGFFFVRSNFGLELHIGNHEGAQASIDHPHYERYGAARDWSHPRIDVDDAIEIRHSGETAYMRRKRRQAVRWIVSNPGEFTRLTVERIGHFWLGPLDQPGLMLLFALLSGLALFGGASAARRLPSQRAAALLIPLFAYPLVYYLVPWQHRYRFPIEWILYLLAGAALWSWIAARSAQAAPSE